MKKSKKQILRACLIFGFIVCGVFCIELVSFRFSSAYKQEQTYEAYKQSATNAWEQQNVDMKNVKLLSQDELIGGLKSLSWSNKQFLDSNESAVKEAAFVYREILSIGGIIDFCKHNDPVKNLYREYYKNFSVTRKKAENILLKAFGEEGFKLLKKNFYLNENILFKKFEDDYWNLKQEAEDKGIKDFNKGQYCKIADDRAVEIMSIAAKEFKTRHPQF